jgi:fumarate reductase subunit C
LSYRSDTTLWLAQRASALVLALCVPVHLATIIYAVRRGLSADEIYERVHGNHEWLAFYLVFVLAVAVHAPIGLRAIASEWLGWRGPSRDVVAVLFAAFLAWMGLRAALTLFL